MAEHVLTEAEIRQHFLEQFKGAPTVYWVYRSVHEQKIGWTQRLVWATDDLVRVKEYIAVKESEGRVVYVYRVQRTNESPNVQLESRLVYKTSEL